MVMVRRRKVRSDGAVENVNRECIGGSTTTSDGIDVAAINDVV